MTDPDKPLMQPSVPIFAGSTEHEESAEGLEPPQTLNHFWVEAAKT